MKHIKNYSALYLLCSFLLLPMHAHEKAVICVPIADLVGQPLQQIYSTQTPDNAYNQLPVCWNNNPLYACPRLHQLLYNDIVDIVSIKGDEACIQISNLFYITSTTSTPQTTYWTATKNLRLLNDLTNNNISNTHIPEPIDFNKTDEGQTKQSPTITLTQPHYDPITQLTFSAGTRFVCAQKSIPKYRNVKVFAIDYRNNKEIFITISLNKCYINTTATPKEHINQYVLLLKSWANQDNSFIPYVWGGSSFSSTNNQEFTCVTKEINGTSYSFFEFYHDITYPKSGFDCSGLIARAAQICNIPYFFKNTTTIGQHLQPLKRGDALINGDLILIKGHVMVVSDVDKNLLIEARSYGHGYGKVHEIELHKVFDSIKNYHDLMDVFFSKEELKRKDKWGNVRDTFSDWKILKIMSLYKDNDT